MMKSEITKFSEVARMGSCRAKEEPWSGEGTEIPGVELGAAIGGDPTSTIPGKTSGFRVAVFLSLICIQSGISTYFPGEIFFLVNKGHLKPCENRRCTAMLRNW